MLTCLAALKAEIVVITSTAAAFKIAICVLRIPQQIQEVLTPIPYIIPVVPEKV